MRVKVKNWGGIYTTYKKWFEENNCTEYLKEYLSKPHKLFTGWYGNYIFFDEEGKKINIDNARFEVLKKGKHTQYDTILYLIKETFTGDIYLIDENAIEEVEE